MAKDDERISIEEWDKNPNTSYPESRMPSEIADLTQAVKNARNSIAAKVSETFVPTDVPEMLYHYTDAAGMLGVFSSGTLWAGDFRTTNDYKEGLLAEELVRSLATDSPAADIYSKFAFYNFDVSEFVTPDFLPNRYVASLSEKSDSLALWRGYGQFAGGFCVGFSTSELKNATVRLRGLESIQTLSASAESPVSLMKVNYDQEEARRELHQLLVTADELAQQFAALATSSQGRAQKAYHAAIAELVSWTCRQVSLKSKHQGFAEEAEWRLTLSISPLMQLSNAPESRVSGGSVVNFFPIPVIPREIVVGPKANFEIARSTLSAYSHSHSRRAGGKMLKLGRSSIPFR